MNRSREPKNARCTTKTGVLVVVGAHVREPETGGHLRVQLDRPELPRPAERVGRVEVDLRAVERPLPLADEVVDPVALERLHELPLR